MYLLDSNVFIEAARRYYAYDICPGFWEWLDLACPGEDVYSIKPVYEELVRGSDDLATWVKGRRDDGRFLPVDDGTTQQHLARVAQVIENGHEKPAAKHKFLAGADPWLVAKALTIRATVVTHERTLADNATSRISIANVCRDFSVPFIDTFALLRDHGAAFHL